MKEIAPDKKTEKTVIFRTDGNSKIGMGHIYRCLSIADGLSKKGIMSLFMLSNYEMMDLIIRRGFSVINLNSDPDDMESEVYIAKSYVRDSNIPFLIIDSYSVTENYLAEMRQVCKVAYIDDVLAFPYKVDYLINYNMYADITDYEKLYEGTDMPRLLLGSNYAPLREEFDADLNRTVNDKVKDVLISTGGADTLGVAVRFAEYLKSQNDKEYTYHFVVGGASPYYDELKKITDGMENIIIHKDVTEMRELMMSCDMALSASGSTLYELCACGVPAVTYVVADNQLRGAEIFNEKGLMISIGDIRDRDDICEKMYTALKNLGGDYPGRKEMTEKMQSLIDGRGAMRIAEFIEKVF